jgi:glycine/D-amino acid oxidase-like deaminating enzyme
MRVVVVGAGAWGLPAAAELARRGHQVTLLDRFGPANDLSSSTGPTRIWRLTHPDAVRVRLALRSVEAMERLERLTGTTVHLRRGLLWRDGEGLADVEAALAGERVPYELVDAPDVGRRMPGLRPDGRAAVWCDIAGPVLAAASMRAQLGLFEAAGGVFERARVRSVQPVADGVRVDLEDGAARHGDVAVLAPGPGAPALLDGLGVPLALRPRLEQVVHFGDPADPGATDGYPCFVDRPHHADDGSDVPNLYAMPTPGRGYKVGIDRPVRDLAEGDVDRTPSETTTADITRIVARDLLGVRPQPLDAQVCSWTGSPDGRFVLDSLPGGIVLACGDSGEGFKFSALMGLVLADLAEGRSEDADVAAFSLARFGAVPEGVA